MLPNPRLQIHTLRLWPPGPQIVTVFGDWTFTEVIKLKWGHLVGPNPTWLVPLEEEAIGTHRHQGREGPAEDPPRRQPSVSRGERPQQKPGLPMPWSRTSSLQRCKKVCFCCWRCPDCDIWYCSPRELRLLPAHVLGSECCPPCLSPEFQSPIPQLNG